MPIVRGANDYDYEKVAMSHSYISTSKFKKPKDLANYLNYLDSNKTAYLEYLSWKIDYYKELSKNFIENKPVDESNRQVSLNYALSEPFCKLCSMLHNKTYMESKNNRRWTLSKWFGKKSECWDKEEPRYYLDKITRFIGYCI